jgi:sugar lactone lactonase YvrE
MRIFINFLTCLSIILFTSFSFAQEDTNVPTPQSYSFQFSLKQSAPLTSAGVYDIKDHLVQILWSMKPMEAGLHTIKWDGKDDDGNPTPKGTYTYRVAVNNSTYTNIGTIGNTAKPANTYGHVPINFEAVAVDSEGGIYTVHDWDEPHHDVIRWSPDSGAVASHSGHPIGSMLKAIAVDEQYAYVTSYDNLQDRTKSKFFIARLKINKTPNSTNWVVDPFTKTGKYIKVYDNGAPYPDGASEDERQLMRLPLLSLAVKGDTIYATDSLAGLVRMYDKTTGDAKGTIGVKLPQTVAIAPDGRVWVGHEKSNVSIFTVEGKLAATPITDRKNINAITFGPKGALYLADQGTGQVCIYDVTGDTVKLRNILGQKAAPGDRDANKFFFLHGLAVDKDGNIITAQNEYFFNGGRLATFSPDGKLMWEQMGLEFQSNGTYGTADPNAFYTFMHHTYKIDGKTGNWQYEGSNYNGNSYRGGPTGTPRVCRIGKNDFFYMPSGDGVQVYRIDKSNGNPIFKLVSILGRAQPLPDGKNSEFVWKPENFYLWSWHDEQGDNTPQPEEIIYWSKPEDKKPLWQYGPMTVDADKNIWIASYDRGGATPEQNSVWMVPFAGIDKQGNPVYEWKNVVCTIPRGSLRWSTGLKMVQNDAEGMTYLYGMTRKKNTPQDGGVWMGGNSLAGFNGSERRWQIILPSICVGLDVIPGGQGGCIIGGEPWQGIVHHYTRDGLLIGKVGPSPKLMGEKPNNPSGLLDFFGSVVVRRNPTDGILDVFVEDDYNLRIAWYRIDDRMVDTLSGQMTAE